MKRFECDLEAEVLTAVVQSTWPHGANQDLLLHARSCEICSEVAAVAVSLAAVRQVDRSVQIPGSGLVWWRAQLRLRREAAAAAERPMIAVQWIAFVCVATLLVSWIASSLTGLAWLDLFERHELLIVAMAALLFGVPAVVYFSLRKE